jgi:outer membrane immunogenic protein
MEGDIAGASLDSNTLVPALAFHSNAEIDRLASIRVRGGYAWDRSLLYVTGGWGWARYKTDLQVACFVDSQKANFSGWALGAGYELAIANNWSVKAEYLYYNLGDKSITYGVLLPGLPYSTDIKIQTAEAGVNYRFGTY